MTQNIFNSKRAEVVKDWLSKNAPETYEIREELIGSEYRLTVNPRNPSSCNLLIASNNGSTQIHLGKKIVFDEVDGLYADNESVLTSVLSDEDLGFLLEAVVNGQIREIISLKANEEVASEGYVSIRGKEFGTRTRRLGNFLRRADSTKSIQYEPYR